MRLACRTSIARLTPLALIVLAVLPAQAAGALTWSRTESVGETGNLRPKGVHISARGDVLALWQREEKEYGTATTHYAWRPPRGRWTANQQLGGLMHSGWDVTVALTPRGQATALWADDGKVFAAEADLGGEFSKPQVIGRADTCCATTLEVRVDDAGNALAAWAGEQVQQTEPGGSSGRNIYAATRTPKGEWSDPQLVRHGTGGFTSLAMNSAGAAVIGWAETQNMEPLISYRPPAGRFGPAERVPSKYWGLPIVAIGESGEVVVATASRSHHVNEAVEAVMAVRQPTGEWSEPVSFPIANAPSDLFVDPSGTATMFMTDSSDRDHPKAQYVTRSRSGEVRGPTTVAGGRWWGDVAMNLRGDVLASLDQPGAELPFELVERSAGQTFSPPRAAAGDTPTYGRVAINDAGQAATVLAVGGLFNPKVQLAVREDPALPVLPFPPIVEVDTRAEPGLDANGELHLAVTCSTACKATPKGILAADGTGQLVAADGSSKHIRAKKRGVVRLRFGSEQSRKVRRAIRDGRKPWLSVSVRARGRSPRPITVSRRIRLR